MNIRQWPSIHGGLLGRMRPSNNVVLNGTERDCYQRSFKPLPMHTAHKNLSFDMRLPNAYEMYKNEITLPFASPY